MWLAGLAVRMKLAPALKMASQMGWQASRSSPGQTGSDAPEPALERIAFAILLARAVLWTDDLRRQRQRQIPLGVTMAAPRKLWKDSTVSLSVPL